MAIKSDRWIRRMAQEHGMINPFNDRQVREGVISYGVSSYGYDLRVADEFKIFTNVNSAIVDPKKGTLLVRCHRSSPESRCNANSSFSLIPLPVRTTSISSSE